MISGDKPYNFEFIYTNISRISHITSCGGHVSSGYLYYTVLTTIWGRFNYGCTHTHTSGQVAMVLHGCIVASIVIHLGENPLPSSRTRPLS
jgi:hypothetical protein